MKNQLLKSIDLKKDAIKIKTGSEKSLQKLTGKKNLHNSLFCQKFLKRLPIPLKSVNINESSKQCDE